MSGTAMLIVRNSFTHDARVIRAGHALRDLGYRPLVLAVVSATEQRRVGQVAGLDVLRLAPSSPFAWARRSLRRVEGGEGQATTPDTRAPRPLVRLHRWLVTLDFYRRAVGVVLRERPMLVHCNDYNTMWIGAAARLATGAAIVYDSHELWPDRNLRPEPRWWLLACEALLVRCAHEVITASPGYADVMQRRYRIARPVVIRNIPPSPATSRRRRNSGPPHTVVYAGALTRHRGLEQAITAMRELPGVTLRLIGPARAGYDDSLLAVARRLGVADRVHTVAPVPPTDVVRALAEADVGLALFQPVCLSHRLVAPNKLFEYMAAGLPVLASDLPVIGALLAELKFGLTTAPDDPRQIADRLATLLEPGRNRAFRAAAAAAARVVTWERERDELVRVYAQVRRERRD